MFKENFENFIPVPEKKHENDTVVEASSVKPRLIEDEDFKFKPGQLTNKSEWRLENMKKGLPDIDRGKRPNGSLTMQKNTTTPVEGDMSDQDFKFPPHHLSNEGEDIRLARLNRDMTNEHSQPLGKHEQLPEDLFKKAA